MIGQIHWRIDEQNDGKIVIPNCKLAKNLQMQNILKV
jgi:hypothetical protein